MKRLNFLYSSFFLIVFYLLIIPLVMATSPDKKIQTVVNLLDYIARDYVGAVENGKVISETEYAEMVDFGASVYTLSSETAFKQQQAKEPILSQIKQLQKRIVDKADIAEIDSLAKKVRSEIITATDFNPLPAHYPSLVAGQALFKTYCVSCHGENGNGKGPAAKGLDPSQPIFWMPKQCSPFPPWPPSTQSVLACRAQP